MVPSRERKVLLVPQKPNQVWSADFMSDALYARGRFRTFNVIDDFNRESLTIEVDTSITAKRMIRIFEILKITRGLPDVLRVDSGPEFTSGEFVAWDIGEEWKKRYQVISLLDLNNLHHRQFHGQTHEFVDDNSGDMRFYSIILSELVGYLNDVDSVQPYQTEKYGTEI